MRRLAGPRAPVTSLAVSGDGRWLGVVTLSGGPQSPTFGLWDLHAGDPQPVKSLAGQALHVAFAPDSGSLVLASPGQPLRRYAVPDLEPLTLRSSPMTTGVGLYTPDGEAVFGVNAVGGRHELVRLKLGASRGIATPIDQARPVPMRFHPAWPDLSPDGKTLATVAQPTEAPRSGLVVCLWDLARRELSAKFSLRRNRCESVHFAPDGRRLVAVCNHQVLVWDVATRKRLAVLDGPPGDPEAFALAAAFTPDGRQLLASFGGQICVFDAATWVLRKVYDWSMGSVLRLAVTPDGLCGVAGGNHGDVVVWDWDG